MVPSPRRDCVMTMMEGRYAEVSRVRMLLPERVILEPSFMLEDFNLTS